MSYDISDRIPLKREEQEEILRLAEAGAGFNEIINKFAQGPAMAVLGNNGFTWEKDVIKRRAVEPEEDEDDAAELDAEDADEDDDAEKRVVRVARNETDLLPCPDRRGYDIDRWCRPWSRKSRGRKAAPLTPDYYRYSAKDGRRRFVSGYRTRCEGIRRRDTLQFFAMQRNKAERLRREG